MVLHRHHHGPLHTVRNVRGSRERTRKFRPGMRRPITPSSSVIRVLRARPFHLKRSRPRPAAPDATHTICPGPEGTKHPRQALGHLGAAHSGRLPPPSLVRRDCFRSAHSGWHTISNRDNQSATTRIRRRQSFRLHVPARRSRQTALFRGAASIGRIGALGHLIVQAGISAARPVFKSYSVRSTAQPRLWREPVAGSATKLCLSAGVASQKIIVTYHGRYASCTSRP